MLRVLLQSRQCSWHANGPCHCSNASPLGLPAHQPGQLCPLLARSCETELNTNDNCGSCGAVCDTGLHCANTAGPADPPAYECVCGKRQQLALPTLENRLLGSQDGPSMTCLQASHVRPVQCALTHGRRPMTLLNSPPSWATVISAPHAHSTPALPFCPADDTDFSKPTNCGGVSPGCHSKSVGRVSAAYRNPASCNPFQTTVWLLAGSGSHPQGLGHVGCTPPPVQCGLTCAPNQECANVGGEGPDAMYMCQCSPNFQDCNADVEDPTNPDG